MPLKRAGRVLSILIVGLAPFAAAAQSPIGDKLVKAYPAANLRADGRDLVFGDGARMPVDDGKGEKPFERWLSDPDIADMFAIAYPAGDLAAPPAKDADPGRARNAALFDKMYGDCRKGEVQTHLVDVIWLPKKSGRRLKVTRINGVADKLAAVSAELDALPASFDKYLKPAAGAFNCRVIAGTDRVSAHGHGIAVDIATRHAHYWRWSNPSNGGALAYKNEIPMEMVRIFEKHGFIWGGKWYHFDTMHFEYRPELLP